MLIMMSLIAVKSIGAQGADWVGGDRDGACRPAADTHLALHHAASFVVGAPA